MAPPITYRVTVPAPKDVDLDGNGRLDKVPSYDQLPDMKDPKASHFTFKNPGGLRVGKEGLIPFDPVPSLVMRDRSGVTYRIKCTNARARFHNPYDSRSFAVGQRVAELNPKDGSVGPIKVIAGFTIDLKPSYPFSQLEPDTHSTGYVLSHAFEMVNGTLTHIAAVPNLVWVVGQDERVFPEWILSRPDRITLSPAEQLLKPLYQTVAQWPKGGTPRDTKAKIESAMRAWEKEKETAPKDRQRVRDLTQEPLRTAIRLSLFQLAGHKPADFED